MFSPFVLKFAFYVPVVLGAAFINLYFLMPRYLEKGRVSAFIIGQIFNLLIFSLCIVSGYYLTAELMHSTVNQLYGPGLCSYYFFGNAVPAIFACLLITTALRLGRNYIQTKRKQQILEKERVETELNFLKHQFNPHFLFNTINSIFFLIHKRPDTASDSLARFSELLRYQLYECNDYQILLGKEINCLKNSVELEKLRQNDNVTVKFDIDPIHSNDRLAIAPFILMTFVENAFKHVSKETGHSNWINIALRIDLNHLRFTIANSVAQNNGSDAVHHSGIGLKNVRRRLDLLYPGRHNLNIQNTDTSFEVNLELELSVLPAEASAETPAANQTPESLSLPVLSPPTKLFSY